MWMFLEVHLRINTLAHTRTHAQVFIDEIDAVGRARGRGGAGVCARDPKFVTSESSWISKILHYIRITLCQNFVASEFLFVFLWIKSDKFRSYVTTNFHMWVPHSYLYTNILYWNTSSVVLFSPFRSRGLLCGFLVWCTPPYFWCSCAHVWLSLTLCMCVCVRQLEATTSVKTRWISCWSKWTASIPLQVHSTETRHLMRHMRHDSFYIEDMTHSDMRHDSLKYMKHDSLIHKHDISWHLMTSHASYDTCTKNESCHTCNELCDTFKNHSQKKLLCDTCKNESCHTSFFWKCDICTRNELCGTCKNQSRDTCVRMRVRTCMLTRTYAHKYYAARRTCARLFTPQRIFHASFLEV